VVCLFFRDKTDALFGFAVCQLLMHLCFKQCQLLGQLRLAVADVMEKAGEWQGKL
jgi:hypothetical protein